MRNRLNKIKSLIDEKMNILKIVFIFFVLSIVTSESYKVIKEINGGEVKKAIANLNNIHIIVLIILGIISVLPMLIYDFTIVKFLPGDFKKKYIIKSGWITNTITNIAGFGGFLGASLRASFYKENASKKEIIYAISKIALFLLSGLSTYSLVSLIMIILFQNGFDFSHYWYLLLGGSLYFPIIFIITRTSNANFFKDLTIKREINLISGSLLEWGSCAFLFSMIGFFLNSSPNLMLIIPIFFAANVLGVVSMLPGGLGSFDLMMLTALNSMGLSPSLSASWIILYRVFYYMIPFLIGTILYLLDFIRRINVYFDELPKYILKKISLIITIFFMYFSAIMMILTSIFPKLVLVNHLYLSLAPYTVYFLGQLTNIVFAFLLIGLARGVAAGVKKVFWPTALVLLFAIINTLWKQDFPLRITIFLSAVLIFLFLSKDAFYRLKLTYSWGNFLIDIGFFFIAFISYGLVGIYSLNNHIVSYKVRLILLSEHVWVIGLVGFLIAILVLVLVYVFLSTQKVAWLNTPFDEVRIKTLLNKFGGNETSHLVFLRDKKTYYYQVNNKDQIMFMYVKKANKLFIMGDPIGNKIYLKKAIDQFMEDADLINLNLVFYEISEDLTMILHEKGFDFIKAGEEGYVELNKFSLSGKKRRGERALMNKFDREGFSFKILNPPYSKDLISDLHEISNQWLAGKKEKGFSLGFFEESYLNQAPIALIQDKDNKIIAFASIMPSNNQALTSIDLMRSGVDAPSGIMDLMFINLFKYCQDNAYKVFNLGMAPFSNVGKSKFSFMNEKVVNLIYKYGDAFYSFIGLRLYKEKYVSYWKAKYFVFRKNNSLIFTMLQILAVVNKKRGS